MKPGVKLAAFALVLAATFGGGTALGAAFAPEPQAPVEMPGMNHVPGMDHSNTPGMNTTSSLPTTAP